MSFGVIALICAVALLGPILSVQKALQVPVVIGELLVGIVIGRSGFGWVDATDPTYSFLAEMGFALVMVVAGSHVPVRDPRMQAQLRKGLLRAALIGLASAPVAVGLSVLFGTGHWALYMVLFISSSAALILPIVNGAGLSGPAVVELLPQVAIADAVAIVALPMAIDPANTGRAVRGAGIVIGAGLVVYLFLYWLDSTGHRKRVHDLSEERELAIELRTSLALIFGLAAIAVQSHVSVMLAGFAFGLALAAIGQPRRLSKQLFALTEGLFGPLFFVWLGSSIDLLALQDHPSAIALGLALGLGALLVHGLMVLTGQPWSFALLTAGQLGVPVAAATLGTRLGVLGPGEDAALLLGALVTVVALAMLNAPLRKVAGAQHHAIPHS